MEGDLRAALLHNLALVQAQAGALEQARQHAEEALALHRAAGDPRREGRTRPLQAKVGDHAIFFRKAAVEVTFEEKRYLVVPHGAILVLIRDDLPI